jgi:hypothetical protein
MTAFVVVLLVVNGIMATTLAIIRMRLNRRVLQTTQRQAEQSARNVLWMQRVPRAFFDPTATDEDRFGWMIKARDEEASK